MQMELTVSAREMENTTLSCEVECRSPVSIRWYFRNRQIHNMSLMSFGRQVYVIREEGSSELRANSLTIVNVMSKDEGIYLCVASNRAGNATKSIKLTVQAREEFWELTLTELMGVIIVLTILIVVLICAVYMVVQQYARFCEQRDASGSDPNAKFQRELTPSSPSVDKKLSLMDCGSAGFKTVLAVSKKNNHIVVDLLGGGVAPETQTNCAECLHGDSCSSEHFIEPLLEGYPQSSKSGIGVSSDHLVSAVASELEHRITQRILSHQLSSFVLSQLPSGESSSDVECCFGSNDQRRQLTDVKNSPDEGLGDEEKEHGDETSVR